MVWGEKYLKDHLVELPGMGTPSNRKWILVILETGKQKPLLELHSEFRLSPILRVNCSSQAVLHREAGFVFLKNGEGRWVGKCHRVSNSSGTNCHSNILKTPTGFVITNYWCLFFVLNPSSLQHKQVITDCPAISEHNGPSKVITMRSRLKTILFPVENIHFT